MCFSNTILVFFLIIQSTFFHLSSADKKNESYEKRRKVRGGGMSHQDNDELF